MQHNMQEMSPADLEATIGGISWEQIGGQVGRAADAIIAAARAVGAGLKELATMFLDLFR